MVSGGFGESILDLLPYIMDFRPRTAVFVENAGQYGDDLDKSYDWVRPPPRYFVFIKEVQWKVQ